MSSSNQADSSTSPSHPSATEPPSSSGARGLIDVVVTRPVAVTMFMVSLAVFGFVSFGKLPMDLLPEISYPTLTVRTTFPGAAPEDVEDRISERIQEQLSTLPKLVRLVSISRAETSDIVLDFDWGTNMTFAVQDVRDKLDGVFLPQGAERPLILRYDPNRDPILRIGLSTSRELDPDRALMQLRWIAENRVKRELESIAGVAAVQVRGGLEEEIRVRVDPFKMAAQNLDPQALAQRLAAENINASGGSVREGSTEYLVRTLNEFQDIAEIENLAIVRRGDAVIRVRDVATVERTHAEREVISRLSGKEMVEVAIYREAGANIVELADAVKKKVFGDEDQQRVAKEVEKRGKNPTLNFDEREKTAFLAHRYRDDAHFDVLSDQSTFIRSSIDGVKEAGWVGGVLAIAIIWLALRRLAPTLIIGVSLPLSVIVTFAPMYLWDVSLNIMSLGGLALGVGMVVDNAIVVLESITRCRDEGDPLGRAAVRGTREVFGAITASTLTSICVFAPIVFVHGIAGRIFGDQATTVVVSLSASLLVAAIFIPMLAARRFLAGGASWSAQDGGVPNVPPTVPWYAHVREGTAAGAYRSGVALPLATFAGGARVVAVFLWALYWLFRVLTWPFGWLHDRMWHAIERAYPRFLRGALAAPWLVVLAVLGLAAFSVQRASTLGIELLPEIHQGEFTIHVGLAVGSPLENTDGVLARLETGVRALDGVALTALTVGVEKDTLTREIEGKHTARLTVRMKPDAFTPQTEEALLARVRELVGADPAVRSLEVSRPTPFALEAPVQIEVLGHDLSKLQRVAADVVASLAGIEGLADVRSSVRPGHPEALVVFDRDKTLEYGLDLQQVSNLVRDQVLGNVSTRFNEGDDRIDVRVMGDEIMLGNVERVLELVVNPASATPVPLHAVAKVVRADGPAEIRRIGNTRAVVVSAATTGLDLGGVNRRIENALSKVEVPNDVVVQLGGKKRELDDARSNMIFALALAMFLVYVVMAVQFESIVQPLIILVSVPLAAVGVIFTLDVLGLPLSVVVFLGLILLAGIVVNNAIVLLDRVNQQRARGVSVYDALVEAGQTRLRPIYMTAMTTVVGLLPMTGWLSWIPGLSSLGAGEGAELNRPLSITVISGLSVSTLLTLVVIPVVYHLVYRRARAEVAA
ncbi:MAG: efflux RND transporter permease subunit [Planctomycetes bacterium]|nr:efflux RND transporter permease subunit [Planctomycetota bacterium]